MIGTRATFRYAKAAVQKAIEDGQLDALAKDMDVVYNTLQNSRDLEAVLQSPIIKSELKYNVMQSVFNQFSDTSKNLLRLLAQNNRINNLDGVALKVKKLYLKHLYQIYSRENSLYQEKSDRRLKRLPVLIQF